MEVRNKNEFLSNAIRIVAPAWGAELGTIHRRVLAVAALALVSWPAGAKAQPSVRLEQHVAPELDCVSTSVLAERLSTRSGVEVRLDAETNIVVHIERWGQGLAATVTRLPGGEERAITSDDPRCPTLQTDIVVLLGIWLAPPHDVPAFVPTPPHPRTQPAPRAALNLTARLDAPDERMPQLWLQESGSRDDDAWSSICTLPCAFQLEPGERVFGLSYGPMRNPIGSAPIALHEDQALVIRRERHGAERAIGWTVLSIGMAVGGVVGVALGFAVDVIVGTIVAAVVAGGSLTAGLALVLQRDRLILERDTEHR